MKDSIRAVALISGGLDSLLAAKVVQDQGIHVEGLNLPAITRFGWLNSSVSSSTSST